MIEDLFKEASKKFGESCDSLIDREECISVLRMLIQDTNAKSGVNTIISEIAHCERLLGVLNRVSTIVSSDRAISVEDFKSNLDLERKKLETGRVEFMTAPRNISVSAVDSEFQSFMKKKIDTVRLTLEDKKEKRNELNNSTIVELPEKVVSFLQEHALLKA